MFKNWKKMLENRKGFSKLEKKGCSNTRNLVILFKKCAKVQSHIARQKRGARTHSARTVPKTFPHALPHAHRTCESAIIRTCAPQPNICIWRRMYPPSFHFLCSKFSIFLTTYTTPKCKRNLWRLPYRNHMGVRMLRKLYFCIHRGSLDNSDFGESKILF